LVMFSGDIKPLDDALFPKIVGTVHASGTQKLVPALCGCSEAQWSCIAMR